MQVTESIQPIRQIDSDRPFTPGVGEHAQNAPGLMPPVMRFGEAHSRLLRPALGFERPQDVLKDPLLDASEKRAILSSWASDACAVEDHPEQRWFIGSTGPVPLNEVLEALGRLDRTPRASH